MMIYLIIIIIISQYYIQIIINMDCIHHSYYLIFL